ncbi:transcriptional regulator domain-containing protein [Sphingopyxis sp. 550A]
MAEEARDDGGGKSRLDFPGFAQEFLRRNPEYRRDYESVMPDPEGNPTAQEVMARRWGLCFPGRSPSVGA